MWGRPPNKRFPRAHLWEWQAGGPESGGATLEDEFKRARSLEVEEAAADKGKEDVMKIGRKRAVAAVPTKSFLVTGVSNSTDIALAISENNAQKTSKESARKQRNSRLLLKRGRASVGNSKGVGVKSGLSLAARMDKTFSMHTKQGNAEPSGKKSEKRAPEPVPDNADADDNNSSNAQAGVEEKNDQDSGPAVAKRDRLSGGRSSHLPDNRTPSPIPLTFGLDPEDENPNGDPHEMLVAKIELEKASKSPLDEFLDCCLEEHLLPEPLLSVKRLGTKSTLEASKRYENLDIKTKQDLERFGDMTVPDWESVSKLRTPDELKLSHYGMGDQFMCAMAKGLEKDAAQALSGKRSFQRFNFHACRITGRGLKTLVEGLVQHPRAKKLDLSNNRLGPDGTIALHKLFAPSAAVNTSLKVIDLSGNGLGDQAVIGLFDALRNSNITWLDLSENNISAGGALAIAQFVEQQRSKSQLQQRHEAAAVATRRKEMNFTGLNFDNGDCDDQENDGGESGEANFFLGLEGFQDSPAAKQDDKTTKTSPCRDDLSNAGDEPYHTSPLETLILDWNQIRGQHASRLIQAFEYNDVVTELSLSWNGFGTHERSTAAILRLIKENQRIRLLRLAHNLFKKNTCEAILAKLPQSKSLLSIDLGGNELHDNLLSEHGQSMLSEAWPSQSNDLEGTSFIYTRYTVPTFKKPPTEQTSEDDKQVGENPGDGDRGLADTSKEEEQGQELEQEQKSTLELGQMPPDNGDAFSLNKNKPKQRGFSKSNLMRSRQTRTRLVLNSSSASSRCRSPGLSSLASSVIGGDDDDCFDSTVWRRRGQCWIKRRWTKQTIWYHPGISGPPSREVFLVLMLPGGASMCTKMRFAPDKQPGMGDGRFRTSDARQSGSMVDNKGTSTARMSCPSKNMVRAASGMSTTTLARRNQTSRLVLSKSRLSKAADEAQTNQRGSSKVFDPVLSPKRRQKRLENPSMRKMERTNRYNYNPILQNTDKQADSTISRALTHRLKLDQNEPFDDADLPASVRNLADLHIGHSEPMCPSFATIMLPPGRVQYKFIVRGVDIFARDQPTTWAKWPVSLAGVGTTTTAQEPEQLDVGTQHLPSVVNCIDLRWSTQPVAGLANPDPGSERPQPKMAWSPKTSIFRGYRLDDVEVTRKVFTSDWAAIRTNVTVKKAIGDESDSTRELLWANFASLNAVFMHLAGKGDNSFALNVSTLLPWLRSENIISNAVTDMIVLDTFAQASADSDERYNAFGRHYKYMSSVVLGPKQPSGSATSTGRRIHANANADDESDNDDELMDEASMVRHQFFAFLMILADRVHVYRPGSQQALMTKTVKPPSLREMGSKSKLGSRPSMLSRSSSSNVAQSPLQATRKRSLRSLDAPKAGQITTKGVKTKFGYEAFESYFEALHFLIRKVLFKRERRYIHRDVFRRGHMLFQDVINVFTRNMDFLREIFDQHSIKGHVLHDFIPANQVEKFVTDFDTLISADAAARLVADCKAAFLSFDDDDFAPGLTFLEFLECLARLALNQKLANNVIRAFDTGPTVNTSGGSHHDDGIATSLQTLITDIRAQQIKNQHLNTKGRP